MELETLKTFAFVNFINNKKARNTRIKMHYSFLHMTRFPENLGLMGNEQVERFHQNMKEMRPGIMDPVMQSRYRITDVLSLKRDISIAEHSRSSRTRKSCPGFWRMMTISNLHVFYHCLFFNVKLIFIIFNSCLC